jgi:hypothetical protein
MHPTGNDWGLELRNVSFKLRNVSFCLPIAPGLIQSAWTNSGMPMAAITTSAWCSRHRYHCAVRGGGCNNVPGRPCICMGRPGTYAHRVYGVLSVRSAARSMVYLPDDPRQALGFGVAAGNCHGRLITCEVRRIITRHVPYREGCLSIRTLPVRYAMRGLTSHYS